MVDVCAVFYVCCSDCVGVCGNVYCIAAIVKDSVLASVITSTNWQTKMNLGSEHLPIVISLQMDVTINPIQHRSSINLKKANWDRYSREIEDKLSKRRLLTKCKNGEKILRVIILKAASHHITSG